MLPGWFGFGSAANADGVDMAQLKDIHAASPFFQTMIANMEMVLAKSDMGIAHRYADLVEDRALAEHVFGVIRREWEATREAVLAITGASDLLAGNPYLAAVIRARLPYIDPLNHLQIDLIRRRRAGDENESIREGLHLTLNGIAAGLRNAG
jgi:phosphoenolpyruvate carboxylase